MYSADLAKNKFSLLSLISIVLIVLGVGCISWVLYSIWVQPVYSLDSSLSSIPISTTLAEDTKVDVSYVGEVDVSYVEEVEKAIYPVDGDNIGSLSIPKLKLLLPIIQGTDDNDLNKGVGHFTQSVLPGGKNNCVLSGHNNTVFRKIGNLIIGDLLIVKTVAGTFTYKVNDKRIVDKDDKTVIANTEKAVLTLTTCYPFNMLGYSSDRYIVSAELE